MATGGDVEVPDIPVGAILDNGLTASVLVGIFFFALWKGWIHVGGEFKRLVDGFNERIADLKTYYESRLADKQAVVDEKSKANEALTAVVTEQSKQITDLVRATETTEHLIEALQEAAHLGGSHAR